VFTGKTKPTFSEVAVIESCFIRLAIGRSSLSFSFSFRHLAICNEFPVPEKKYIVVLIFCVIFYHFYLIFLLFLLLLLEKLKKKKIINLI